MTKPSPFLEGTNIQLIWDSTSLGWLKTCPRLYQYQMIEQRVSRGENVHLRFGIHYHAGLEYYDHLKVQGHTHESALEMVVDKILLDTWDRPDGEPDGHPWEGESPKTRETLLRSIIWYLDQFGDNDPAQTITLANGRPAVELTFRLPLDWGPQSLHDWGTVPEGTEMFYSLSGHLDRLVTFLGDTYVMDRKTTEKTLSPNYFSGYEPDNQMSLYTLAAKSIFDVPVKGVIIDAAQTAVGFTRFERGMTFRNDAQLDEWLLDLANWLDAAEGYAVANYWPMNDKSCKFCAFRRVCSRDPAVRPSLLESDFEQRFWNPADKR